MDNIVVVRQGCLVKLDQILGTLHGGEWSQVVCANRVAICAYRDRRLDGVILDSGLDFSRVEILHSVRLVISRILHGSLGSTLVAFLLLDLGA